jgi:hypothetical protein
MSKIPDTFEAWFEEVERDAMGSKWCVDASWPEWPKLFAAGLTPKQAVDELFTRISAAEGES